MKCFRISLILIIILHNIISIVITTKIDYRIPLPIREEVDHFKSYQQRITNPCINLYEYSCGNYVRNVHNTYDGYLKNVPDLLLAKIENQVKNLLTTTDEKSRRRTSTSSSSSSLNNNKPDQVHAFERKAIRFYKTCQDNVRDKTRIHQQIIEIIKGLSLDGGWPIWKENWNSGKFNWFKVLAQMKLYGIIQVIDSRIAPFPYNTTGKNFVISCKPKFVYNQNEESKDYYYAKKYEDDMKRIFQDYGANHDDAIKYAKDLIKFEKELLKIINSGNPDRYNNELDNDNEIYNENDFNDLEQYEYYKLKFDFPHVDWDRYLEIVFGFQIKDTYLLTVNGARCMRRILEFISYSHPTTAANFLFVSIINDIEDLANPTGRPNFCVKATNDAMGPVISYMYLHRYFNEKTEIDIYDIWNTVKMSHLQIWKSYIEGDHSSYNYGINYNGNDENDTLHIINKKLNNMRIVFFSDHIDILERASNTYNNLDIDRTNFIRTYFRFIRHNNLLDVPKDHVRYLILFSGLNIEPFYVYEKNALIIPPGILQSPYYQIEWPKLFKYSKLGFLLSRNIAKAFNKYGRELDEFGNRRKWWQANTNITKFIEDNLQIIYNNYKINTDMQHSGHNIQQQQHQQHQHQQRQQYHQHQQYQHQQYQQHQHQQQHQTNNGKKALKENWSDLFGIKTAFKAYNNKLHEGNLNYHTIETIPRTGLNINQTFFVSFSQLFCGEYLPQYERVHEMNIPFELRVNLPLVFMDECKLAFNCN